MPVLLDHKLQVEEAAKQFAKFTYVLKDFDAHRLTDTLVQFHDLNFRYQQFSEAIQHGNAHRIEQCQEQIKLLLSLKHRMLKTQLAPNYLFQPLTVFFRRLPMA